MSTSPISDGVVDGDLVLVASGDLAPGGRNAMEGRFDHTFDVDSVDHVYAYPAPNAARGRPVTGLDDLAQHIVEAGVSRADGDVDRHQPLERLQAVEGPVPLIFKPTTTSSTSRSPVPGEGEPATVEIVPQTGYFTAESDVETVAEDGETVLSVTASEDDPTSLVANGMIAVAQRS